MPAGSLFFVSGVIFRDIRAMIRNRRYRLVWIIDCILPDDELFDYQATLATEV